MPAKADKLNFTMADGSTFTKSLEYGAAVDPQTLQTLLGETWFGVDDGIWIRTENIVSVRLTVVEDPDRAPIRRL
jgi:hypothetical protein